MGLGRNSEFEAHTTNAARGVPDGARNRIDVHAHYIPGFYREALIDAGLGAPDGIRELPAWDAETALKTMDRLQVADAGHLHYGSDYPFTPASACVSLAQALQESPLLDEAARAGIWGRNALWLFPDVRGLWT